MCKVLFYQKKAVNKVILKNCAKTFCIKPRDGSRDSLPDFRIRFIFLQVVQRNLFQRITVDLSVSTIRGWK